MLYKILIFIIITLGGPNSGEVVSKESVVVQSVEQAAIAQYLDKEENRDDTVIYRLYEIDMETRMIEQIDLPGIDFE